MDETIHLMEREVQICSLKHSLNEVCVLDADNTTKGLNQETADNSS